MPWRQNNHCAGSTNVTVITQAGIPPPSPANRVHVSQLQATPGHPSSLASISFVPLGLQGSAAPANSRSTSIRHLQRRNSTTGLGISSGRVRQMGVSRRLSCGTKVQSRALCQVPDARGDRMARRHGIGATLQAARKHSIIKEIQAAVARELAARSEVPKTMPQRIAELLRELHRRLRNPNEEGAARLDPDRARQPPKEA
jgi:hypothetical protein